MGWVSWINQGRLVADRLSYLYTLEAAELAQVLERHMDAFACTVLYARMVQKELVSTTVPSDILNFDVLASCRMKVQRKEICVTIVGAKDLPVSSSNSHFFGKSDFYVICQVAGL